MGPTPGPRDWIQPESQSSGVQQTAWRPPLPVPVHGHGHGRLYGWLALLCGAAALAMGLIQPGSSSTGTGFLVSTIGITGIAFGLRAFHYARQGMAASTFAAGAGISFGTIGGGLMVYALAAFLLLPQGIMLPHIPSLAGAMRSGIMVGDLVVPQARATPTQPPAARPAATSAPVIPFASVRDEQLALATGVGSLSVPLRGAIAARHTCPQPSTKSP